MTISKQEAVRIPDELRKKIPPLTYSLFFELRGFCTVLGLTSAILGFFGPIAGPSYRNGYLFFLGPIVCPLLSATPLYLKPWNPYGAFSAHFSAKGDFDKSDPDAKRLVELFRSKEAQRALGWRTAKMIVGLFTFMAISAALVQKPLEWSTTDQFYLGFIGATMGSFIAVFTEHIYWCLRTWAQRSKSSP